MKEEYNGTCYRGGDIGIGKSVPLRTEEKENVISRGIFSAFLFKERDSTYKVSQSVVEVVVAMLSVLTNSVQIDSTKIHICNGQVLFRQKKGDECGPTATGRSPESHRAFTVEAAAEVMRDALATVQARIRSTLVFLCKKYNK